MKDRIVDMIIQLTGYEELKNEPDVDLIEEGILDSLSFMELIIELENEFDIEIQPTQIPSDTWKSVDGIVGMVNAVIAERAE